MPWQTDSCWTYASYLPTHSWVWRGKERDKLSAVSETQTRKKVKKQELLVKEEQLDNMISNYRSRLEQVLGHGELAASLACAK